MSQLNTLMCVSKSDRTGGTCRGDSGGKNYKFSYG